MSFYLQKCLVTLFKKDPDFAEVKPSINYFHYVFEIMSKKRNIQVDK